MRASVRIRVAPRATELLAERARLRSRPGSAAVRAAAAGPHRGRLGDQATLRRDRQRDRARRRPSVLPRDRRRDQDHVARPRLLPGLPRRTRRGRVPDAQVQNDGGRRGREAEPARRSQRGRRRTLQDPGRPACDVRWADASPLLDRRVAAGPERASWPDEPRRAEAAPELGLREARARGTADARSSCPA